MSIFFQNVLDVQHPRALALLAGKGGPGIVAVALPGASVALYTLVTSSSARPARLACSWISNPAMPIGMDASQRLRSARAASFSGPAPHVCPIASFRRTASRCCPERRPPSPTRPCSLARRWPGAPVGGSSPSPGPTAGSRCGLTATGGSSESAGPAGRSQVPPHCTRPLLLPTTLF